MKFVRNTYPILYFAGVWLFIACPGLAKADHGALIPLAIAASFIGLAMTNRSWLKLLVGFLMFFWSILILFAYLSDASKLVITDSQAWSFLIFGGLVSGLNFLMSYLIVKKSIKQLVPYNGPAAI